MVVALLHWTCAVVAFSFCAWLFWSSVSVLKVVSDTQCCPMGFGGSCFCNGAISSVHHMVGFACWRLDLVCWSFFVMALGAWWKCVGVCAIHRCWRPGGHVGHGWTYGFGTHLLGVPCSRRWAQRLLFLLLCQCRIGEAAVPGPPPPVWSLGVCNPSGLLNKGHLLDPRVDCWIVCETHLTQASCHAFRSGLRADGSSFKWFVSGAPVKCRSTVSAVGAWSGVAMVSKWPARALPVDWPRAVHDSSRLLCSTVFIHDLWVSGVTVYGTPTGPTHPHAKQTTDRLLSHAVSRIAQSHGPRFVGGDFNHDPQSLESIDQLVALGFRDVQDVFYMQTGIHPKPTCKMKTRRDFLYISPELQTMLVSCTVDHNAWPDHAAVIASFRGGNADLVHFPWPVPGSIPWNRLHGRAEGSFVDFSHGDCDMMYSKHLARC